MRLSTAKPLVLRSIGNTSPNLRRAGVAIAGAIDAAHDVTHPLVPAHRGIFGTIFTGPPRREHADLRNVTVLADGQIDRSPGGTSTAAVMAVLDAMGLVTDDRPFVHEGLIDTCFTGRIVSRTSVGEYNAIVAEIEGAAWITGEHTFFFEDDDPLRTGVLL